MELFHTDTWSLDAGIQ